MRSASASLSLAVSLTLFVLLFLFTFYPSRNSYGESSSSQVASATSVPIQNPNNDHWYLVVEDKLRWTNAQIYATSLSHQEYNGYLATLTSSEENAWVLANLTFEQTQDEYYFLGGYQLESGSEPAGGWVWATNEAWQYTNWSRNEPGNTGGNENRLEYMPKTGKWNDNKDSASRPFIVEFGPETTIPTPTPVISFNPVMNPNNNHCYAVIFESKDWHNAKIASESLIYNKAQGHLATLTSALENDWVEDNVDFQGKPDLWIGGYQSPDGPEPAGGWLWVTGELWSFADWNPNEPNDAGNEDHLSFRTSSMYTGNWNDNGSDKSFPFIVEFDAPLVPPIITKHWNPDNNHFYEVFDSEVMWEDANDFANETSYMGFAGHLATITSETESAWIANLLLTESTSELWLGGKMGERIPGNPAEGWQWVTEEAWNYVEWLTGEPNNEQGVGEDGLLLQQEPVYGWNDKPTFLTRAYLVEYESLIPPSEGNYALGFDSLHHHAQILQSTDLGPLATIGLELWVYPEYANGRQQTLISKGDGSFRLLLADQVKGTKVVFSISGMENLISDSILDYGQWSHIAVFAASNEMSMFINGELDSSLGISSGPDIGDSSPIFIGAESLDGMLRCNGLMDEIRLWSELRSEKQVHDFMDHHLMGNEPGLAGYWKLNEGIGQLSMDSSSNGRDLLRGTSHIAEVSDPLWISTNLIVADPLNISVTASIHPQAPLVSQDLSCTIQVINNGGHSGLYPTYQWSLNSATIEESTTVEGIIHYATTETLSHHFTQPGDIVGCEVAIRQGHSYRLCDATEVVVSSATIPSAPWIRIVPRSPIAVENLAVDIIRQSIDPIGEVINYEFRWYRSQDGGENFEFKPEFSVPGVWIPGALVNDGDFWRVEVLPYRLVGGTRIYGPVAWDQISVGANQAPTIKILAPPSEGLFALPNTTIIWEAEDVDSDPPYVDLWCQREDLPKEAYLIMDHLPAKGSFLWQPMLSPPISVSSDMNYDGLVSYFDLLAQAARWEQPSNGAKYRIIARAWDSGKAQGIAYSDGVVEIPYTFPTNAASIHLLMDSWHKTVSPKVGGK
jgi:Concanavalin A-like lectin/glucanases superfamily/Lectin C-type domain